MPSIPKPTLNDLCAAVARLTYMLERADHDTLLELHERVSNGRGSKSAVNRAVAQVVMAEIDKRRGKGGT